MRLSRHISILYRLILPIFIIPLCQAAEVDDLSSAQHDSGMERCSSKANVLGVSRIVEIDTKGGPTVGNHKNKEEDILRDNEVILTFDDGPSRKYTEAILNALDSQCTKATFFVIGHLALTDSKILREIDQRGHIVASHTWSHRRLDKIGSKKAQEEIELGFSAVEHALSKPSTPFFRFPYLAETSEMRKFLSDRNIANVRINIDSRDFRTKNPSVVRKNVMTQLKKEGKGIILFHDIHASTASALRTILKDLKDNNYKVVQLKAKEHLITLSKYNEIIEQQSLKGKDNTTDPTTLTGPDFEPKKKEEANKKKPEKSVEISSKPKPEKRNWDDEPFLTRKSLRRKEDDTWAVSPLKLP